MNRMITLANFEQNLPGQLVERGRTYFEEDFVTGLEEKKPGTWTATVEGTNEYQVEIVLAGNEIEETGCDCPHDVPFCKHVIAVLYELTALTPSKRSPIQKTSPGDAVDNLPEKELRDFVREYARTNTEFRSQLHAWINRREGVSQRPLYERMIRQIFNKAARGEAFLEYQPAIIFAKELKKQLLDQAGAAIDTRHYLTAADIAFVVIHRVHEILGNCDDSAGGLGGNIDAGFELLTKLAGQPVPDELNDNIFEEALEQAADPEYRAYGFDENWLDLLVKMAHTAAKQSTLMTFMDNKLAEAEKEKDEWTREDQTDKLLEHKKTLLRKMRR